MEQSFHFRQSSPRTPCLHRHPFNKCWVSLMGHSKDTVRKTPVAHTGWLNTKPVDKVQSLEQPNTEYFWLSDLHKWKWDSQAGLGPHWWSSPRVRQESECPNLQEGRTLLPSSFRGHFPGPHSRVYWPQSLKSDLGHPPLLCAEWGPTYS